MIKFQKAIYYEDETPHSFLFIEYNKYILELENYSDFITNLFLKVDFSSSNKSSEEIRYVLHNTFIYFLLNGNNLQHSRITSWPYWKIFLNKVKNKKEIILDYSQGNIDFYMKYLTSNQPKTKFHTINKNETKQFFLDKFGTSFILSYFIFRKTILFRRNKNISNVYLTNYDRYYENNSFFNSNMLNSKEYLKLLKEINLKNEKKNILFIKYGPKNIRNYIFKAFSDKNNLFLEDVLKFKHLSSYFFKSIFVRNDYILKDKSIMFTNPDEEFIYNSFQDFMEKDSHIILAIYYSSKEFINQNNFKYFAADSEKNYLFSLFHLAKSFNNKKIKSLAFTHEMINKYYIFLPLSKQYNYFPDYKFVWSDRVKFFLSQNYNIPSKNLKVFEDPRWFNWRKYKLKKKSVLIISQDLENFYNNLFLFLDNNEPELEILISKGYIIYFKAHPSEVHGENTKFMKLKTKYSKYFTIIEKLDFIPEYSISDSSTLSLELIGAGSKGYFTCKENYFLLDDNFFDKMSNTSFEDFLKKMR